MSSRKDKTNDNEWTQKVPYITFSLVTKNPKEFSLLNPKRDSVENLVGVLIEPFLLRVQNVFKGVVHFSKIIW